MEDDKILAYWLSNSLVVIALFIFQVLPSLWNLCALLTRSFDHD